ncbi:MAG: hypothetical protein PHO75_04515 [Candidatus Shapirobacteria bacterium]|nr:hypothetical protein [Candidatus Shapirobacteria bacterium]
MMKKILLVIILSFMTVSVCLLTFSVNAAVVYDDDNLAVRYGSDFPIVNTTWYYQSPSAGLYDVYTYITMSNSGDDIVVLFPYFNSGIIDELFDNYGIELYGSSGSTSQSYYKVDYYKDYSFVQTAGIVDFLKLGIDNNISSYIFGTGLNTGLYDYLQICFNLTVYAEDSDILYALSNGLETSLNSFLQFTFYDLAVVPNVVNDIEQYNNGYRTGYLEAAALLTDVNQYDEGYDDGYLEGVNSSVTSAWFLNMMSGVAAIFNIEVFDGVKLSFFIFFPLVIGLIGRFFWLRRGGGNG